jgi:hypothetical protein
MTGKPATACYVAVKEFNTLSNDCGTLHTEAGV